MPTSRREKRGMRVRKARRRMAFGFIVLSISLCVAAFSIGRFHIALKGYAQAEREYESLRRLRGAESAQGAPARDDPAPDAGAAQAAPLAAEDLRQGDVPDDPLLMINPDYVGWITVDGAGVDYPIVHGADNKKYLGTTFEGVPHKLGAIFMDYRNHKGFSGDYAIIYGHNARDGSLFGSLKKLLGAQQYPDIQISTVESEDRLYRIFAVRKTDIHDIAYRWKFEEEGAFEGFLTELGAPEDTEKLLTLSTCTSGGSDDERLLVLAALCRGEE